jgi:hypothetical protein
MTYTLTITRSDGGQQTALTDYRDDEAVKTDLRHLLSAEQPTIAIARGSGEFARPLGVWTWSDGQPTWKPGD